MTTPSRLPLAFALLAPLGWFAAVPASAQPAGALNDATGPSGETAAAYCSNLADQAQDARFARQLGELRRVEAEIEERIAALETKRSEYETWLERRRVFMTRAEDSLVDIYSGMRPDAASEQLAEMDELTAAAVLAKVPARTAAGILNEMDAQKAARLATIVAGLSRADEGRAS